MSLQPPWNMNNLLQKQERFAILPLRWWRAVAGKSNDQLQWMRFANTIPDVTVWFRRSQRLSLRWMRQNLGCNDRPFDIWKTQAKA